LVTSLLTLYAVSRVWTKAFWRPRIDAPDGELVAARAAVLLDDIEEVTFDDRDDVGRMPIGMLAPTVALIIVGLALTVLAGPIFAYSDRAAAEVLDRGRYISAVAPGADASRNARERSPLHSRDPARVRENEPSSRGSR
jgi:multicomponent Na+:H+ antiporter subunit D